MMQRVYTFFFGALLSLAAYGQQAVQVSGVILAQDSARQTIPNAKIQVKGRPLVMESGDDGFFSIAAIPGDSVIVRRFGFQSEKLWVPDTLAGDSYLAVIQMAWNTLELEEVILYPWPRPEDLNRELLAMEVKTTERDIALRNLAIQSLKEQAKAMGMDAGEMQRYILSAQAQSVHNANRYYGSNGGTAILGRLSDPFAWSQFFNALKRGDFSR
jgi:hypothetical protein